MPKLLHLTKSNLLIMEKNSKRSNRNNAALYGKFNILILKGIGGLKVPPQSRISLISSSLAHYERFLIFLIKILPEYFELCCRRADTRQLRRNS